MGAQSRRTTIKAAAGIPGAQMWPFECLFVRSPAIYRRAHNQAN
jgi:hypothetical protein